MVALFLISQYSVKLLSMSKALKRTEYVVGATIAKNASKVRKLVVWSRNCTLLVTFDITVLLPGCLKFYQNISWHGWWCISWFSNEEASTVEIGQRKF